MLLALTSFLVGVAGWSFAEYALHNWYGHVAKGRNEFSRQHLAHHADGDHFAPTPYKIRTALLAMAALTPVAMLAVGVTAGGSFSLGFILMYGAYEVIHRRCHTHPPRNFYARWARKHHFHHHFASPKRNHGITSPIWDVVFRTYDPPGRVRVPVRHAMRWLVNPETGEVWARYADDYELARPKRQRERKRKAA